MTPERSQLRHEYPCTGGSDILARLDGKVLESGSELEAVLERSEVVGKRGAAGVMLTAFDLYWKLAHTRPML